MIYTLDITFVINFESQLKMNYKNVRNSRKNLFKNSESDLKHVQVVLISKRNKSNN